MFIFVHLLDDLILAFCCSNLTQETGGLELTSTITPVLQANQLTKYASHPNKKNTLQCRCFITLTSPTPNLFLLDWLKLNCNH